MKSPIIAVILLALTTPAFAANSVEWNCGNGATVGYDDKDELVFSMKIAKTGNERRDFDRMDIGSQRADWKWDFTGRGPVKIRLNGKLCKRIIQHQ